MVERQRTKDSERRERAVDAPGMLEFFEAIGDEMQRRYYANTDVNVRLQHPYPKLTDSFTLSTGEIAIFDFITRPVLFRNNREIAPDLPDLWLPSGHLELVVTADDGTVNLDSYTLGRGISRNTHENDTAIIRWDKYKSNPDKGQSQRLMSSDILSTNNNGALGRISKGLTEIDLQLEADTLRTPKAK